MAQQIHPGDPAYAPPLIRPPSPASSIGTSYGLDETTASDTELDDAEFARKCEASLHLDAPGDQERRATRTVLLPHSATREDERIIFEHVMANLRKEVRKLEEDELFERAMQQGSQVGREEQPSSNDIDVIMRSIMQPNALPADPPVDVAGFTSTLRGHGIYEPEGETDSELAKGRKGKTNAKGKGRKP